METIKNESGFFKKCLIGCALGFALASGSASAALTYTFPVTNFEDDDIEFLVETQANGQLDVGDRLVGVLEIDQTSGGNVAPQELTGAFDVTIISKTLVFVDPAFGPLYNFVFGPTAGGLFANADADGGATVGAGTGTMVALYLDNSDDLNLVSPANTNCTSQADCLTKAGYGTTAYITLGFEGDADEGWIARLAPDQAAVVAMVGATTNVGTFQNSMSIILNNTGLDFGEVACTIGECTGLGDGFVDWIGSGQVLGGAGLTNGAFARSDFDGRLAPIPEPGTIALLAFGVLGLGFGLRRSLKA